MLFFFVAQSFRNYIFYRHFEFFFFFLRKPGNGNPAVVSEHPVPYRRE